MTKISQLFPKPVPTADNIPDRDTLLSQDMPGLTAQKLTEVNSLGVSVSSLAVSWAKKYYSTVAARENRPLRSIPQNPKLTNFEGNRAQIVDKLTDTVKLASEIAWNRVEAILGEQIDRQGIDRSLINPLEIAEDTRNLYRKAIDAYGDREPVFRLSVLVGKYIIQVRQKYSQTDPLVLGFVTLEFQYTSKILLGCLSESERSEFAPYLKIVDDYLHIPYGEINLAAANLTPNSKALLAVQHLLQNTTQIASSVYDRAISQHPGYRSSSGYLTDPAIKISGIRDVEIFQSYLCWCVLEGSIRPVQQELFPICVMLYPKLHVSWELVEDMLLILFWEISERLPVEDVMVFLPYLRTVTEMFSSEVFED
jgi:Phycobilisome protein